MLLLITSYKTIWLTLHHQLLCHYLKNVRYIFFYLVGLICKSGFGEVLKNVIRICCDIVWLVLHNVQPSFLFYFGILNNLVILETELITGSIEAILLIRIHRWVSNGNLSWIIMEQCRAVKCFFLFLSSLGLLVLLVAIIFTVYGVTWPGIFTTSCHPPNRGRGGGVLETVESGNMANSNINEIHQDRNYVH